MDVTLNIYHYAKLGGGRWNRTTMARRRLFYRQPLNHTGLYRLKRLVGTNGLEPLRAQCSPGSQPGASAIPPRAEKLVRPVGIEPTSRLPARLKRPVHRLSVTDAHAWRKREESNPIPSNRRQFSRLFVTVDLASKNWCTRRDLNPHYLG